LISENTYLPILVLTADATTETKQRALSGGAHDFLTKPFDLVEVGLRIKNLLYTSFLQQQMSKQNLILEEKVKERTVELEIKNTELMAAKEKAETSDKLKTSFINNISHEIRTPLNGILGFGQILTDPDLEPQEKELFVGMLNESSDRLINTVTNFLDVSLLSSGNQEVSKKEFDIDSVINEVVDRFNKPIYSKKLALIIDRCLIEKKFYVKTDKELISKALFQLVDNAIKFTMQGSITLGYKIEDTQFEFYINDTGIGISEENQKHIFENFRQGETSITRQYEGSGLGLTIAKGIVELLDGTINLTSEKEKGTNVRFTIPNAVVYEIEEQFDGSPNKLATSGRHTILVAEDNEINFVYMKIILQNENIDLLHAENGVKAVELFKSNDTIDLVLMDLKMPEMDGFEATRIIKSIKHNIPVFAVTAYAGFEDKLKTIEVGCDEFITKPVKKDVLFEKLAKYGIDIR
jgi:two-component system, sensor histidine kinase and response regulator